VNAVLGSMAPEAWVIDVPGRFAYYRPSGTGFGITFLPADLAADVIGVEGFKAVPGLTRPAPGITQERITELARQAIELYVDLLRRELQRPSPPPPVVTTECRK